MVTPIPDRLPDQPADPPHPLDLTCYLHPGWRPLIRPAPATRDWMDQTPESFAYRCLPLNIANAHGWEVLTPCAFEACWTGAVGTDAVIIRRLATAGDARVADPGPVSIFGQGVLSFHIQGLFRTPPGWNLWIGGSPNRLKDAIQPLTGIVETDWSPFTFTMNWRFTRPGCWVRFDAGEPICFFFPLLRHALHAFTPRLADLERDPALLAEFTEWSRQRQAFQERMSRIPPTSSADRWQKQYYRGQRPDGRQGTDDHLTRLRLPEFKPVAKCNDS